MNGSGLPHFPATGSTSERTCNLLFIPLALTSATGMIRATSRRVTLLKDRLPDARALDLHDVPSRYPNGLPSGYPHAFYGRDTAEQAAAAADRIVGAVTDHHRAADEADLREPGDAEAPTEAHASPLADSAGPRACTR